MINVPLVQRQVSTAQTVHRQEVHVVQSIDTEVNISVNMQRQVLTERKSVGVARTQCSMKRSLMCQRWKIIKPSSGKSQTPEIMRRQVPMILKMNKAAAQLNRVGTIANTTSPETRAESTE